MQLVAYGAQDVYLTGNPQITFFKVVYRRHTNFSMECYEHPIDSARPSGRYSVQITRNGDLINKMMLRLGVPTVTGERLTYNSNEISNTKVGWVRRLGHAVLKSVEIDIGGSTIDKHFGVWLDIWYELTHTTAQERGYRAMIGDVPEMTTLTGRTLEDDTTEVILPAYTLYIPFQFWFCRNTGLALPLIALQYHEVRVYIELEEMSKLICWSGASAPNFSNFSFSDAGIMVDYIYLDSEERRRFAQVGHEYLIEQLQFPGEETVTSTGSSSSVNQKFKLNFNHPCKEIVWALKCGAFNGAGNTSMSGSRGRFLAYTNDESKWDDAVDYAARNLANGMFSTTAPSAGTTVHSDFVVSSDITDGESATFEYNVTIASQTTVVTVNVENSSGSTITEDSVLPLWMVTDAFVKNSYNLCKDLNAITVALNVTTVAGGAGTVASIAVDGIVVTDHDLTLREVSVPVEDWTDLRVTTVSGKNKWDTVVVQPNNYGLRLDGAGNPVASGNLQLNGHDRFDARLGSYFNYVQPANHHTRTPADGVNVYSFGLNPEQHQPSGTANLSRIDNTLLVLVFSDSLRANKSVKLDYTTDSKFYIFAVNYNILRVMSGMGGLAYSN